MSTEARAREHGASEKAIEAAMEGVAARRNQVMGGDTIWPSDEFAAVDALAAAHDPALGLDRSVCLRDVVEDIRGRGQPYAAKFVERIFTLPSSQDREKEE